MWGTHNECVIKDLGPETLYYFKLGVSLEGKDGEVFSKVLTTATKDAPPMLFYLFKSAERQDIRSIESFLIERKDSSALDAFDRKGETALIKAVSINSTPVVRRLLEAGANVNHGGYGNNRSPLMYACFLGHFEAAQLLIESGADINYVDCNKSSSLHYAVDWNHMKIIKLLLESGADINTQDSIGWTPFMRAVIHRCKEDILTELLTHKADIQIKDRNGKTAMDLAKLNNTVALSLLTEFNTREEQTTIKKQENLKIVSNLNTKTDSPVNEMTPEAPQIRNTEQDVQSPDQIEMKPT